MARIKNIWRRGDDGIQAQITFGKDWSSWIEVSKLPDDSAATIHISKAELDRNDAHDLAWALAKAEDLARDWDQLGTELALIDRKL